MNHRKPVIGVIGPNKQNCTPAVYDFGLQLGKQLIDLDTTIVCGGKQGIMEAVCKGAMQSGNYQYGCTVGILPEEDASQSNPYCDILIPSNIGIARNLIIVNTANILVAVAGGSGTLSEIAFAWQRNKPILCHTGFGGWSANLAGKQLDERHKGKLREANNMKSIKQQLLELLQPKI